MVEPPVIEQAIEADHGAVLRIGGAEDEPIDPGVEDRAGAHQAGFERYIERRPREAVISDGDGRPADGQKLGMGRGIVQRDGLVVGGGEPFTVADDHRPDRRLPGLTSLSGLRKSGPHPTLIGFQQRFHKLLHDPPFHTQREWRRRPFFGAPCHIAAFSSFDFSLEFRHHPSCLNDGGFEDP